MISKIEQDLSLVYDFQGKSVRGSVTIDRIWITKLLFNKILDYLKKDDLVTYFFHSKKSGSITHYTLKASLFLSHGTPSMNKEYYSILAKSADGGKYKNETPNGLMAAINKHRRTHQQTYDLTLSVNDYAHYIITKYPMELISIDFHVNSEKISVKNSQYYH